MDIATLKQQARSLEQQGDAAGALAVYRQILDALEAMGAIRQELPLLIKVGDLHLKCGDADAAVDQYERAAEEYAAQGAAQPVISLCAKIVRADPKAAAAYLRLASRLLEAGFTEGARQVLLDYAQRAKLEKTRAGLERLAGRPEAEVAQILAKAIEAAAQRAPKPAPRPPAPRSPAPPPAPQPAEPHPVLSGDLEPSAVAPSPSAPPEPPAAEPPIEPSPPSLGDSTPRLTVPVGALDAEPPSLLEQRPPESRPDRVSAWMVERPTELPEPEAAEPAAPGIPPATAPAARAPGARTPSSPDWPRPPTAPGEPPDVQAPVPSARWGGARRYARAPSPKWLWPAVGTAAVVGGAALLIWLRVIPLDRLRGLASRSSPEAPSTTPAPEPTAVTPDSLMARDTATVPSPDTTVKAAATATPADTGMRQPAAPRAISPAPPALPPGVSLTRPVVVVQGLEIETVAPLSAEGREGFTITQVLRTGQRIVLEEFPSDTAGAGEIAITSLPGDTVVGHVRASGLEVTLKGVLAEDLVVQLLLQLVEVRPPLKD